MVDLNQELFKQLAAFANAPVSSYRKPSDYDIALQIMKNSGPINFNNVWSPALSGQVQQPKPKGGGHSLFGRIIDVLSRPLYASASAYKASGGLSSGFGMFKDLVTGDVPENPLDALGAGAKAGLRGLQGKDKTTYSQLIKQSDDLPDFMKKGATGFATGLGADILGDPITFLPIAGPAKAGIRAGARIAGKEAPYFALPKATKQAMKAAKIGTPKEKPYIPILDSNKVPKSLQAVQAVGHAMNDAPLVNAALEQGSKEAAIAEQILSPQQAALHQQTFNREASQIMRAAEASPAAKKTYHDLMKTITFKSRGPVQNAIDRNATKLTIPMNSLLQKSVRGPKGRFLPKGTSLPTAGIEGARRATSSLGGIFSHEATKVAAKKTSMPKVTGVFGPVNTAVSKAITESAHIPITKVKPGETLSEASVVRGIMARFNTSMGQKDLRPLVLDHTASALARASERVRAMERAFQGYSGDEALEAWDIARNAKPRGIASSETVTKLADILTGQMETFFRSRAIPEDLAKGNSVAMRTGMTMKDLNRALARYNVPFKFTNAEAVDPVTQALMNYGHRSNWLISWETHAPKSVDDLKRFVFGLQSAAEQLTAEYAFIDDIAYRMGSRGKTATKNVKVDHPRLGDYYFDKEIADQLSTALKTMNEVYSPKSPVTKFIRHGVSMWKGGVTIYNPRHHIANVIGDTFLMWMAGINDPRVFGKAGKVLFANKGLYKDLASVDKLVGSNAVKNAMAKPGTIVAKNKSGVTLSAQQAYIAAFNYGLLQRAGIVEDIVKEGIPLPGRLAKPLGGKGHAAFAKLAETREHYVKIAHFIGAFEKSRGKDVKQIFEDVAHEVRKWHPDGLDLTKEEQAIRALGIPFYSWMRKSTPLIIEGALLHPQKAFTSYAKVNYNLQQSLGIEGTSLSDPYPDDQLIPSWLRDDNVPVLGKTGLPGIAGMIGGLGRQTSDDKGNPLNAYTMLGPTNPVQDLFTQFGGFRNPGITTNAALSQINPMARIPLEFMKGKEFYTDIPLENRKGDYITNQIPMVNQVARMTNVGPFGKTSRGEKYGVGNREAFINWVFNANLTGTGPYIKSAEFEQLPEKRKENQKIREFSASIGYPIKDKGKIPQWIRDLYNQRNGGE